MLTLAVISPVEFRGHANRPPLRPALCTPCHLSLGPAELTPLTKWLSSTLACIIWCLTVAKVLWKINNLESLGANRRRRRKRENGIMCLRLPIEETRGVTARAYSFWWDNALLLWEQSPLTLLGKNVPHTWHQIVLLIKKACNGQQLVCPNLCKWGKLSKAVIKPFMLVSKKKTKNGGQRVREEQAREKWVKRGLLNRMNSKHIWEAFEAGHTETKKVLCGWTTWHSGFRDRQNQGSHGNPFVAGEASSCNCLIPLL